jgi:hypothetical protein
MKDMYHTSSMFFLRYGYHCSYIEGFPGDQQYYSIKPLIFYKLIHEDSFKCTFVFVKAVVGPKIINCLHHIPLMLDLQEKAAGNLLKH